MKMGKKVMTEWPLDNGQVQRRGRRKECGSAVTLEFSFLMIIR